MAASTIRYTLTSAAYVDVSVGATRVWFTLEFNRQQSRAIRLALGTTPPDPNTPHYQSIDPGRRQVGSQDLPETISLAWDLAETTDRVYVRAEADPVDLVVHTNAIPLVWPT